MKYAIPTDDGKTVSSVFGRAKSFAIHDDQAPGWAILDNGGTNAEHGAGTGSASFLVEQGVGAIIALELGPKAAGALQAAGVRYVPTKAGISLDDALAAAKR